MAKEWIDVADTAVKIGLGSLITGVFTYLGVKFSHNSQQAKFLLEHKVQVLEKISSDAEEYFSAWNALISRIAGTTKLIGRDLEHIEFSENQMIAIKERDEILKEAWISRNNVVSRLRLLKSRNAVEKFRTCVKIESELREMMFFKKEYPHYMSIV